MIEGKNAAAYSIKRRDITLIVTFYNEEQYLKATIDSLKSQNLGEYTAEVLLVDGASTDGSRKLAEAAVCEGKIEFRLLDNPKRITPAGLNLGIAESRSDIIGFGGAHALYPRDYLRRSIELIKNDGNDAVGGRCDTFTTFEKGSLAKAMALLYLSPIGAGARSLYRERGPAYVETVFGGTFKRAVFERCGGYDETLVRGQDIDFNNRARREGFKILYHPDLNTEYLVRTKLSSFWRRAYKTGLHIAGIFGKRGKVPSLHYFAPLALDVYLVLLFGCIFTGFLKAWVFLPVFLYLVILSVSAVLLSRKASIFVAFMTIPLFFSYHVVYGVGISNGYISFLFRKRSRTKI